MQICEMGDGVLDDEQESATELRAEVAHGGEEPAEQTADPLIAKEQER